MSKLAVQIWVYVLFEIRPNLTRRKKNKRYGEILCTSWTYVILNFVVFCLVHFKCCGIASSWFFLDTSTLKPSISFECVRISFGSFQNGFKFCRISKEGKNKRYGYMALNFPNVLNPSHPVQFVGNLSWQRGSCHY